MRRFAYPLLLLPACLAAACSGDGGEDPPPDTTAPTVTDTRPRDGAADVATMPTLTVTFSEPVASDAGVIALDPGPTITVTQGDLSDDGTTFTAEVAAPLDAGAEIAASVTGFRDEAGNVMAPFTFTFTVRAAPDLTAPEVVAASPMEAAADVPPNLSTVRLTFSEAMDEGAGSVGLSSGGIVDDFAFTSPTQLEVTVSGLTTGTAYALSLSGFADLAGNVLDDGPYLGDGALDFTTAGEVDETAPTVTASDPIEGANDVDAARVEVSVVFSEVMDVSAGQGSLSDGGAATEITPTWSADQQTATFAVTLVADTDYALALTGFVDLAGNALDGAPYLGDGALDFRVPGDEDVTRPQVTSALPPEGTTGVPAGLSSVSVVFDEAMDTSVTAAPLVNLTRNLTSTVTGTWSAGDTTLTFDVTGLLEEGRAYALDLTGLSDVAGNPLDGAPYLVDGRLDFATPVDAQAPQVISSVPVEGAQDVLPVLAAIEVTLDEPVDPATVDAALMDGMSSTALTGVVSNQGRTVRYALPGPLADDRSYTVDLTGLTDLAGNALDGFGYLGDGLLDFTVPAPPTGFDCGSPLNIGYATESGGTYTFALPSGSSGVAGTFDCDASTGTRIGDDYVIVYDKVSDTLDNGGDLLHVYAESANTNGLNVEVFGGACDGQLAAARQEKCYWNKTDLDVYLDLPPGRYWVWVGKSTSGAFPGATVDVEEVPPTAALGEGCWAPWDTASAIYTPPATAADPHTWTIPGDAVNSFDMDVTWGGVGSISCDDTPPYGDIHGVDTVIEFVPQTAGGVLQINATSLMASNDTINMEVLDRCTSRDPARVSLGCSADADAHEIVTTSTAPIWIWLSTEATSDDWPGATVTVREINPQLGESCATGRPLAAGANTLTLGSTQRLGVPACLAGAGGVSWFRYTVQNGRVQVTANGAAELGIVDADAATELGCRADGGALGYGGVFAPGTTLCVAVPAGASATQLTVTDVADNYTGVGTTVTPVSVSPAVAWNTEYWMAASPSWVYFGRSGGDVQRFAKTSTVTAVEVFADAGSVGRSALALADERVFSLDQTTGSSSGRVYRIFDGSSMAFASTPWDTMPSYPTQDMRGFTYDGAQLIYATHATGSVDVYAAGLDGPAAPTLLGTNSTIDNVVGMAADATYLYFLAQSVADNTDGLYRLARADLGNSAAQAVLLKALDINTLNQQPVYLDDPTSPSYLYVREANPSSLHVIEAPGSMAPIDRGATLTLGGTADYAWTYDPTTNSIFWYETETDSNGRIVQIQ